jgi:hypothetical protein
VQPPLLRGVLLLLPPLLLLVVVLLAGWLRQHLLLGQLQHWQAELLLLLQVWNHRMLHCVLARHLLVLPVLLLVVLVLLVV